MAKVLKFCFLMSLLSANSSLYASGPFIGAQAGLNYDSYKDKCTIGNQKPLSKEKKGFGVLGGFNAGYIMQPNEKHVLFGGALYFSLTPSKKSAPLDPSQPGNTFEMKSSYSGKALGMVGVYLNPKAAMYALAGVSYYTFEAKHSISGVSYSNKKKLIAPTAGAGAFYKISDHMSIGGEAHLPIFKKIKFSFGDQNSSEVTKTSIEAMIVMRVFF